MNRIAACLMATLVPLLPACTAGGVPRTTQPLAWTLGSAEASAITTQTYRALVQAVEARLPATAGTPSAILGPDGTPLPCTAETAARPAAVFDVDETLIWNVGHAYYEARSNAPFDEESWAAWEREGVAQTVAVPGAKAALDALRALGVTPVFNTNRNAGNAKHTEAALAHTGLGPATHGDTLFLKGDVDGKSGKDGRRAEIAKRFCVLALVGDQNGDFTDALDNGPAGKRPMTERRALAADRYSAHWGTDWFVLPNPLYGGWNNPPMNRDEVVAPDQRWTYKGTH